MKIGYCVYVKACQSECELKNVAEPNIGTNRLAALRLSSGDASE